ncbi:transcriptional repressor p66-alpha [Lingula anatina]|uniref:Transcriptional repressor p66-alpha n=1 Tax=Lingula anatina TaxID=7574 RepID=A0A1S3HQ33_LINAN|nr:transcriptional repressor p66-alpha [Lingula anatina]XP_013386363.1 transcriptional repressor p66-alpha [Lingula anatina]XP_013387149.1 transcriptional repressor p66-alpha [Lingula anatina]XP_013387930.1 transcriptional repressor p66-alpha [Lingula anatina]|eukprot:XP_013385572.1 transcriptional repressor p66-alpha [Lingula anatina]
MSEVNHSGTNNVTTDNDNDLTSSKRLREEEDEVCADLVVKRAKVDQVTTPGAKSKTDQSCIHYNGSSPNHVEKQTVSKLDNPSKENSTNENSVEKNSCKISKLDGLDLTDHVKKPAKEENKVTTEIEQLDEDSADLSGKGDENSDDSLAEGKREDADLVEGSDESVAQDQDDNYSRLTTDGPDTSNSNSNTDGLHAAVRKDASQNESLSQSEKHQRPNSNSVDTTKMNGDVKECVNTSADPNENGPIDLSTNKNASRDSSPDIIMLSDDDSEELPPRKVNGDVRDLTPEEVMKRDKIIHRLQEELRNEETKLVLLKKIRQSQTINPVTDPSGVVPGKSRHPNTNAPPPLIRGGQNTNSRPQQLPAHMARGQHASSGAQGPPPLVMAPGMRNGSLPQGMRNLPGTTPPNVIPGYRPNQPPSQVSSRSVQAQQQAQQENITPEQRQAAAKLALRKQLEKTLLQIPPPKPPPPEMNFIPSLATGDFIWLVGLEEVVKHILDADKGKSTDVKYVFNPFTCVQCKTDFTPVWKRDKPGSKNVICEQCVTSNQKKALKQEHTNRLKSAFVKALQQEQEIEQRMQSSQQHSNNSSSSPSTTTSSVTAAATSYKPSPDPLRQHPNMIQAHQAAAASQLRSSQLGFQSYNPRMPFNPYQLPFNAKPSDLQRQYLLDMIPRGGLPQSTVLWKS